MSKRYENLMEAMCKELDKLDRKYSTETAEMSVQDVEKADILYHALKSAATYHAMKDAEEWEEDMEPAEDGMSSRTGRSYYGRSGAGRPMRGRMSGHYPDMPYYGRY